MAITVALREYSKEEVLSILDPLVSEWFSKFPDLTPPQRYAIVNIHEGRNVLVAAPTGSGKTLSAFISIISELVSLAREGKLEDRVYCVYVSPLRSLNNDIYKNLMVPLNEIRELAKQKGLTLPEIRVAVRTGDTTQSERSRMLRKPPHILITTPESLAIILVAPKFREKFRWVKWVIVDEIHELCSSKRGVHLTLSLERLQRLSYERFVRIGLSATIHPLEEVAKFLVGYEDGKERDCVIADTRFVKPVEMLVTSPVADLIHTSAGYASKRMYKKLSELVKKHRTTLVFTNTRSGTERVVYHLSKLKVVDGDKLAAHHSSLSRELRKGVEDGLKEGRMKVVVCVSGDEEVLTDRGWVKIKDVKEGMRVLGLNGGRLEYQGFRALFSDDYHGYGYRISTAGGASIKCTPEHRFLVEDGPRWIEAERLSEGDRVAVVRGGGLDWDEVKSKERIRLDRIYSLVDVDGGNYVINGFVCKNSSTSLELGIDIGSIDLVVQIGSPKSISRCIQRVGRSGHALDRVSKGVLMALELDDLVEDAVMVREAMKGKLDRVYIPENCLDVLAQHLVGMAVEGKWKVDEAYRLVRRSYCYRNLKFEEFMSVIKYLSGQYRSLEDYRVYGKIWFDPKDGVFGRRGSLLRVIYSTNIGTIPDEVSVKVYTMEGRRVGSIEEEFLERLGYGDVFILGGKTYRFEYADGFRAYVSRVEHEKPTVPSWFSEMLPLSFDLGEAIGRFRKEVFEMLRRRVRAKDIIEFIKGEGYCDDYASRAILGYMKAEYEFLKSLGVEDMPDNENIVVEDYVEGGRRNLIFNCVFGRRVNDALSRAYAYALTKLTKGTVMVTVSDSGFMLTIPRRSRFDLKELLGMIKSYNLREELVKAVKNTEMVRRRFRHCATRSLMILRNYKGHEIKVGRQQVNAQMLLELSKRLEGFPVLKETYREIVEDLMDVKMAEKVLRDIEEGRRRFVICPTSDLPSPFTHSLILSGYSDLVLMEDRKELLRRLYDEVLNRIRKRRSRRNGRGKDRKGGKRPVDSGPLALDPPRGRGRMRPGRPSPRDREGTRK